MKVTVLKRQTLSDIALQVYGDISGLPGIARANGLAMTAELAVGQVLQCPDVAEWYCRERKGLNSEYLVFWSSDFTFLRLAFLLLEMRLL